MKEGKQREMAVRRHAVNLLQTVEIPEHVAIKGVHTLRQMARSQWLWMSRPTAKAGGIRKATGWGQVLVIQPIG